MRIRTVTTLATGVVGLGLLSGCAAPEPPDPTPTVSREEASAVRCLADHSPWSLDLDAAFDEWFDSAEHADPVGGAVTGSARMSFTREREWRFVASSVDFELHLSDGARESTTQSAEYDGDYTVTSDGGEVVLSRLRVASSNATATATAPDGSPADAPRVPAPSFPWEGADTLSLTFSCTEHRLVVSDPSGVPTAWTLQPGA